MGTRSQRQARSEAIRALASYSEQAHKARDLKENLAAIEKRLSGASIELEARQEKAKEAVLAYGGPVTVKALRSSSLIVATPEGGGVSFSEIPIHGAADADAPMGAREFVLPKHLENLKEE